MPSVYTHPTVWATHTETYHGNKRYSALASVTECEGTRLLYECEIRDWIIVCGGISSQTGSPHQLMPEGGGQCH